jgi:hypothetical protein
MFMAMLMALFVASSHLELKEHFETQSLPSPHIHHHRDSTFRTTKIALVLVALTHALSAFSLWISFTSFIDEFSFESKNLVEHGVLYMYLFLQIPSSALAIEEEQHREILATSKVSSLTSTLWWVP